MNLQLTRPIAFIDLETTGVQVPSDRIVEIAIVKIMPDGSKLVKRKLVNPEMPIPAASSNIHGITDDMVKDAPTFKMIANEVKQFLENCDLGGYNSDRFDIPLLVEEFLRIDMDFPLDGCNFVDVQKVFHLMEPRNLSAAYKFYCGKTLENAHSAEADATATWEILESQLEKYPQIGNTIENVVKFTGSGMEDVVDFARRFIKQNGIEIFNFGKHKGRQVVDVLKAEPQYYDWMMKNDFSLHTKKKITEIFNRVLLKKA